MKSRYSLPSTSQIRIPSPRTMYGGYGALKVVVRVEPPGSEAVARSNSAADPRVRARYSSMRGDVTRGSSASRRSLSRFDGARGHPHRPRGARRSVLLGHLRSSHGHQLGLRQVAQVHVGVVRDDHHRRGLARRVLDQGLAALVRRQPAPGVDTFAPGGLDLARDGLAAGRLQLLGPEPVTDVVLSTVRGPVGRQRALERAPDGIDVVQDQWRVLG